MQGPIFMIHDLFVIKSRNDRRYLDNLGDARRIAADIAQLSRQSILIYKENPITGVMTLIEEVLPRDRADLLCSGV
jgi:hypothetical protein